MKKLHEFDEVFDAQRVFRLLLEAMANPARRVSLGACAARFPHSAGALLAIGMTLLDNEVSFHVFGDVALAGALLSLTLSHQVSPEQADFLFVPHAADAAAAIAAAKCGTLASPHLSATVILLDDGVGDCPVRLWGAGIDGVAAVSLSEAAHAALLLRDAQGHAYPQGMDLVFVTGGGQLYAIPRLTQREVR